MNNLSVPIEEIAVNARVLKLLNGKLLIGTAYGSVKCRDLMKKCEFSSDCYNDGHLAAINKIEHSSSNEIITSDIFGGVRKWNINFENKKFDLLQMADFDQNIYDLCLDENR